jgi:predicted PolB exonuclease-like 3'-5' exonuclease
MARAFIFDIETTGLEPYIDRIVAIGLRRVDDVDFQRIFIGEDEKQILEDFINFIEEDDTLIGFNIRNFDLPHLKARCIINHVPSKKLRVPPLRIIDLSELLHFGIYKEFGANPPKNFHFLRLDDFARLFGMPAQYDLTGMLVKKWFEQRRWDLIKKHLEDDLAKTEALYNELKKHFPIGEEK